MNRSILLLYSFITAGVLFFWASHLSFFPIPWSDDSVYLLAGSDLFQWPPLFRMHSQAMAVPTYDQANFNNMPLLPIVIGLIQFLGIKSVHALRFFGMAIFGIWCGLLAYWMYRQKIKIIWIWLITLAALTSPVMRWAAMPVHPEVWQGLLWLLMLLEIAKFWGKQSYWRLSLYLALAAGFHFQAIVWVLPVAVGVFPYGMKGSTQKKFWEWGLRLWNICWRVLLFLSPWIFYVFWNWDLFWIQMEQQFSRLAEGHPYIKSAHSFFHSLFVETGNPLQYPKFYNAGKIAFWIGLLLAVFSIIRKIKISATDRPTTTAALAAVLTTFYLWLDKPETWFILLFHMALFPIFILSLPKFSKKSAPITVLIVFLIAIQTAVAAYQYKKTKGIYQWGQYHEWVSCIDEKIGDKTKIWLPTALDVLVDLHKIKRERDYWGHNCFPEHPDRIANHMKKVNVMIHTWALPTDDVMVSKNYTGAPRSYDIDKVTNYPWIQYREYTAPRMGEPWRGTVCQRGPFWAFISLKAD